MSEARDFTIGAEEEYQLRLADAIRELVDRIYPIAEELDDGGALAGIPTILERGNAAHRIRTVLSEREDLATRVGWLVGESVLGTGLDRRTEQRGAGKEA